MAGSSGKADDSKGIDYIGGDITLQTDIPKAKAAVPSLLPRPLELTGQVSYFCIEM